MGTTEYDAKIAQQIAQYATADIHDNPPIHDYWTNKHLRPKLNFVLGVDSVTGFYVEHIFERAASAARPEARLLSLGAGDAALELQIARHLVAEGLGNFQLECLELSPILIERANRSIRDAGLQAHVQVVQSDLNSWSPSGSSRQPYTAVLAHHVLHHLVELETLFANIARAIGDTGVFLTSDMIGRNGHMRWPEALAIVNAMWETLPDSLKYNHALQQLDETFQNWDCTTDDSFEGVRAQDILPLLVERFQFEKFLAFGNLPEVFLSKTYGSNFDPNLLAHTHFVDSVEQMNALLLELGVIKPTMMFAVMSNSGAPKMRIWKNLSPRFCVRDPSNLDLGPARQKSQSLTAALEFVTVDFGSGQGNEGLLRSGWSYPEDWGTWMDGTEAVLEMVLPAILRSRPTLEVTLRARVFVPRRLYCRSFTFLAGDQVIGKATFSRDDDSMQTVSFTLNAPGNDLLLLRVIAHEEVFPAEDGSADIRRLGLGLIDLTLR